MGVWGLSPQPRPGAEPLVQGGSGGQSPEAESFSMFKRPMEWENLIDYLVF